MKNVLKLPQVEIFYPAQIGREILFVAGGRRPSENFFREMSRGRKILAIDKGIEICRDLNILPQILIGDFDSAESSAVNWARENKLPIECYPADKDLTDTQLALNFIEKNYSLLPIPYSLIITGIFGGRFDHLFSNIFTCAAAKIKACLADEREIIFFVNGGENFSVKFFVRPYALSLLPITEICEGITLKNVHWELENATLRQNFPNAVSNRVEEDEIKISVAKGTLAIYFNF
ncbi:MAG: thiamine diphosphokinase [Selenomonadaceae bacterium]|nr:thiamine diphosphokinase [Selenomonadaceae bacterium]MBQ7629925.1 thiamine diphosphokinase [Selenomonadaceae bacterium]